MGAVVRFPLFVYGTLQDEQVLSRVLGRPARPGGRAELVDRAAFTVIGERFPVLRPLPGARTEGRLLTGLCEQDLHRLGWYEGDEYRLVDCSVIDLAHRRRVAARLFEADERLVAGPQRWSLARWQDVHRPAFLNDVGRWMAGYDATRPALSSNELSDPSSPAPDPS